ncbi:unnamed protein product [Rangifer tarandus platyrhynchus]|uniref:Uncharacterized protein n=2 Tax=Rangifer tarandus platyrhynchus TaxID=3082113 RepID=A0ABN8Y3F5_RANTA|nr:unnamed protein product [Rangifer tarandus platyrhynchus]
MLSALQQINSLSKYLLARLYSGDKNRKAAAGSRKFLLSRERCSLSVYGGFRDVPAMGQGVFWTVAIPRIKGAKRALVGVQSWQEREKCMSPLFTPEASSHRVAKILKKP